MKEKIESLKLDTQNCEEIINNKKQELENFGVKNNSALSTKLEVENILKEAVQKLEEQKQVEAKEQAREESQKVALAAVLLEVDTIMSDVKNINEEQTAHAARVAELKQKQARLQEERQLLKAQRQVAESDLATARDSYEEAIAKRDASAKNLKEKNESQAAAKLLDDLDKLDDESQSRATTAVTPTVATSNDASAVASLSSPDFATVASLNSPDFATTGGESTISGSTDPATVFATAVIDAGADAAIVASLSSPDSATVASLSAPDSATTEEASHEIII